MNVWLALSYCAMLQATPSQAFEHWLKQHPQAKRLRSESCECPELIAAEQAIFANYTPFSNTGDFDHDGVTELAVTVEVPKGRQVLVFTGDRAKSAQLAMRHGAKAHAGAVLVFAGPVIDDSITLFVDKQSEVPIVTDLQFGIRDTDGWDTLVVKKDKWSLVPSCMTDTKKCIPAASR